ncbi:RNF4.2 family protein [Megaselia abdita]
MSDFWYFISWPNFEIISNGQELEQNNIEEMSSQSLSDEEEMEESETYNSDSESEIYSSFEFTLNDIEGDYVDDGGEQEEFEDQEGSGADEMDESDGEAYETTYGSDHENSYEEEYEEGSNVTDNSVMILDCTNFPVPLMPPNDGSYVAPASANLNMSDRDSSDSDDDVVFVPQEKEKPSRRSSILSLSCAICLESLKEKKKPVSTSCGHLFCYSCLTTAINKTHKCPLCNAKQNANTFHRIYF